MAGRGKCQWTKADDTQCKQDAEENFILCLIHLKEQKKLSNAYLKNVRILATGGDIVEDGAPSVLEQATEEKGGGPLDVLNGDKNTSYKFARYNRKSIFKNQGKGYKLIRVETEEGANRPTVGQDKDVRETYRDQVNEKGFIQLGDLVLMERPKSVTKRVRTEGAELSKRRVDRILSGEEAVPMNQRADLPKGIRFVGQRGQIGEDMVFQPPVSNKKTYLVPENYNVK